MGRTKKKHQVLLKSWLSSINKSNHYTIDGCNVFCQPCGTSYQFKQNSQLQQHNETAKHTANAKRFDAKPEKQQLLNESKLSGNAFYEDICEAFIAANIPWEKIHNPIFKAFLEKYTKLTAPDASTLRKCQLQKVYSKAFDSIREEIGECPIWLAIDESTDVKGRFMANVLVAALRKHRPSVPHLISVTQLESVNNSTISQLVLDSLNKIWPGETQTHTDNKFLLLLTDGVPYMLKAGKNLKRTYPKLIHVTCVAHAIHLVAERVRCLFPVVDKMVAAVKAVFRKAPSRVMKYKSMLPNIKLPPQPTLTRWGTWIEAVTFYCDNFYEVKSVIDVFDENDAVCIANAQQALATPSLNQNLAFISAHFSFMASTIEKLEADGLSLLSSLAILNEFETKINSVPGEVGKAVKAKLSYILEKNKGLQDLKNIGKILSGEEENSGLCNKLGPLRIANFSYAPVTTCETERSFSIEKAILSDRRTNLTPQNLEKILVSHFELSNKVLES